MSVSPIWPAGSAVNDEGEITFHGRTAASLLDEFGSPLYVIDTDDVRARATKFVHAASHAFNNTVTHVSFAPYFFCYNPFYRQAGPSHPTSASPAKRC